MVLGLFSTLFVPWRVLEATILNQQSPTSINQISHHEAMPSGGGGIGSTLNGWNTKYCNDPTTARDSAMLVPCELGNYTRISLRCISTHANIWKPRGSQCWIEDIACLLFIRRYRRSRGTWEYEIWAARRKSLIDYVWGWQKERYIIENRIDALIDELNIDKKRITSISHQSAAWNVKKMATTALLCALSITPYIYINLGDNKLNLKKGTI